MARDIELPATEFRSICSQLVYRRRKVRVQATESVMLTDLNWSGGTRNTYHGLDIESGAIATASQLSRPHPMDNEAEGARIRAKEEYGVKTTRDWNRYHEEWDKAHPRLAIVRKVTATIALWAFVVLYWVAILSPIVLAIKGAINV